VAIPRFPFISVLGLAVTLLWLRAKCRTSCSQDRVFPVPHRERKGEFSNHSFGLLQSLLGLLHKSYSDSASFQEDLAVLRVSHTSLLFIFYEKKVFRNFSFGGQLVFWVISLFSHMILSRPKNMSPPMPISPLSPKLNQWLGLSLFSQSLFMGPVNRWFDALERQPSWSSFMFCNDTSIPLTCS
jgi:hypothetical protein